MVAVHVEEEGGGEEERWRGGEEGGVEEMSCVEMRRGELSRRPCLYLGRGPATTVISFRVSSNRRLTLILVSL